MNIDRNLLEPCPPDAEDRQWINGAYYRLTHDRALEMLLNQDKPAKMSSIDWWNARCQKDKEKEEQQTEPAP